jgi:hypothetical protein
MGFLHTALCMIFLFSCFNNVTMHNEGVYIPFPSCALQLSSLELISIYLTLIILKCLLSTKGRELKAQGPITVYKCASLNLHINVCATISRCFQKWCWLVQLFSASALACLICWRCSCIRTTLDFIHIYFLSTMTKQ